MDGRIKFIYNNSERVVEDVTFEQEHDSIIGMEINKDGEPTNQIKRYKVGEIIVG